jgi:glucans biosynthesis protein
VTVSTRIGRGGEPGKPRPAGFKKIVVEFAGGPLDTLPADVKPEPVVWASHGEIGRTFAEQVPRTKRWRAVFDIQETDQQPVDLRLFMKAGDQPLTETWLFQLQPDAGV